MHPKTTVKLPFPVLIHFLCSISCSSTLSFGISLVSTVFWKQCHFEIDYKCDDWDFHFIRGFSSENAKHFDTLFSNWKKTEQANAFNLDSFCARRWHIAMRIISVKIIGMDTKCCQLALKLSILRIDLFLGKLECSSSVPFVTSV